MCVFINWKLHGRNGLAIRMLVIGIELKAGVAALELVAGLELKDCKAFSQ